MSQRKTPVAPGTRWGLLKVLRFESKNASGHKRWWVQCECGTKTLAWGHDLVKHNTRSCGVGPCRAKVMTMSFPCRRCGGAIAGGYGSRGAHQCTAVRP